MRISVLIIVLLFSLTAKSQSFKVDSFFAHTTQNGTVSGTVLDGDMPNEALALADILVKGTDIACTTDIKGNFNLNLQPGSYTLVVNFIGYETVEIENIKVLSKETTNHKITMSPLQLVSSFEIASLP